MPSLRRVEAKDLPARGRLFIFVSRAMFPARAFVPWYTRILQCSNPLRRRRLYAKLNQQFDALTI